MTIIMTEKNLIINRNVKYTINYFIINQSSTQSNNTAFKFTINTFNSDMSTFTYTQNNYFKFFFRIS